MRSVLFILILILAPRAWSLEARVLIEDKQSSQELVGEFTIQKKVPRRSKLYPFALGKWKIERTSSGIHIQNLQNQKTFSLKGRAFEISGDFQLKGRGLKKLSFHAQKKENHWVAHLPIDQYLYGVMAAEVPSSWPAESLKAQAVASRTYFLFKKLKRKKDHYDVRSDIMDQVFLIDGKKSQSVIEAVDATHGLVLVSNHSQRVFPAYFHADCGGQTSTEGGVWRQPSSVNQSVADPVCQRAPKNNWNFSIARDRLMSLLRRRFLVPLTAELRYILPRLKKNHRAHYVDFIFSENIYKRMSANDFRRLLGYSKLRSTQFQVQDGHQHVHFSGRGFGHGVGMCQWGAQRWARKGKKFREILSHYYPGA
ncbi:MAG: SpoIID/LytB domain-containing protein, partial [Pseudomonadota bacterium]